MTFTKTPLALLFLSAFPCTAALAHTPAEQQTVTIEGQKITAPDVDGSSVQHHLTQTSDPASLLKNVPGISLNGAGALSALPALHGLADERLRILVDDMEVTAACANHMNPPLSYAVAPRIARIDVWAGVTPVSLGGDSLGGTIAVHSAPPHFAPAQDGWRSTGQMSLFARSINHAKSATLSAETANDRWNLGLDANFDRGDDYRDAHGNTVTSTYYESHNLAMHAAMQTGVHTLIWRAGQQTIPKQGFANQQMDMVRNQARFAQLDYSGAYEWGQLKARAFWQNTHHLMDLGEDKPALGAMMYMPMHTWGRDLGYSVQLQHPFSEQHALRIGHEFRRFTLNDWWPAVDDGPWMGPDSFLNINQGRRDRLGLFAEWESVWNTEWSTLFGIRHDQVHTQTEAVHGYSEKYALDAQTFNALPRDQRDRNWDLTLQTRYTPEPGQSYEGALARKSRSPSLYERYTWAKDWMSAGMINWFGDGNAYYGNPLLRPEVAHTLSFSAHFSDPLEHAWSFKLTPYYTRVHDLIDVELKKTANWGSTFGLLQFKNRDARLYGLDASAEARLLRDARYGELRLSGSAALLHGARAEDGSPLYHQMPAHARLNLQHTLGPWENHLEVELVQRKDRVDPLRFEPRTAGYALVDLGTRYTLGKARFDVGVTNLFNRATFSPLGGMNIDAAYASGWSQPIGTVPSAGRSINLGLTLQY